MPDSASPVWPFSDFIVREQIDVRKNKGSESMQAAAAAKPIENESTAVKCKATRFLLKTSAMIPLGYMLKEIVTPPKWMKSPEVRSVYSVSGHVSTNFMDYIPLWKHNGWWMFDDPSVLKKIARNNGADLGSLTMLYFEVYDREFYEHQSVWKPILPEPRFVTDVKIPGRKTLRGYDVVTFSVHTSPECSPLSCSMLATKIRTNDLCLLDSFEDAKNLAEQPEMHSCEPGPYRVVSVYTVT